MILGRKLFEMIKAATIKAKRNAARLAGSLLCKKACIPRSRLSDIERGYVIAPPEELERIDAVLDELIRAKAVIEQTAAALGWPVREIR